MHASLIALKQRLKFIYYRYFFWLFLYYIHVTIENTYDLKIGGHAVVTSKQTKMDNTAPLSMRYTEIFWKHIISNNNF